MAVQLTQGDIESLKRTERIAELALAHTTNAQGEFLANVHENAAFQEIFDYHGTEKMRHRLGRKLEQVCNGYSVKSHLFQHMYYTKGLTLADETELRNHFKAENEKHNNLEKGTQAAMFLAYWPIAYRMSRHCSPATWGLCSVGYILAYTHGLSPMYLQNMQSNLNTLAMPIAQKYKAVQ